MVLLKDEKDSLQWIVIVQKSERKWSARQRNGGEFASRDGFGKKEEGENSEGVGEGRDGDKWSCGMSG